MLHAEARLDLQVEDRRERSEGEVPELGEQREPAERISSCETRHRRPEHEEGGGRADDRGRRLERDVQRRRAIVEIEARATSTTRPSRRQSRARRQRQASAAAARHPTFPLFDGRGTSLFGWAGCRFGYA